MNTWEGDGLCEKFDTYCKIVIRYKAYKIFRDRKRWKKKDEMHAYYGDETIDRFSTSDTYSTDYLKIDIGDESIRIDNERLYNALNLLSEKRKQIIIMSYVLGLSDSQIGARLSLPKSTVQHNRCKALQFLRGILEEGEFDDHKKGKNC